MSPRRRNLLEAFQSASREPTGPTPPAGSPAPESREPLFARRPSLREALPAVPRGVIVVLGLGVAFALGYSLAGRGPAEAKVEAPAPAASAPPPRNEPRRFADPRLGARDAQPVARPQAKPPSASPRIEDSALFAPENLWTVVVESYSSSNEDLAWVTYEHLRAAGLSVFPPVASKNLIVVLVGAAPTSAGLEKTEAAVRELLRDGKKEYADAYRTRIDKLIPRPTNTNSQGTQRP